MARRVNTRFLIILTVVVVGLGLFALVAKKIVFRQSPDRYIKTANQLVSDGKYLEAVKDYERALKLNGRKPEVWVAYGDALNQLSPLDLEYLRKSSDAWHQALAADPNYQPALTRLLSYWSQLSDMYPSDPNVFKRVADVANRLHQVDPGNEQAEIAVATAVVRPWLAGQQQDEAVIHKTLDQLDGLLKKYPANADLPLIIAQTNLKLADTQRQRGKDDDAAKLVDHADQVMDAAVKRSPTAAVYLSAAQFAQAREQVTGLQLLRSNTGSAKAKEQRDAIVKRLDALRQKKRDLYARARELAKGKLNDLSDPLPSTIYIAAAHAVSDDRPDAEKILRELCAARPDDQQARLALADQLADDPATRAEAISIVDKPFATTEFKGPKAYLVREYQVRTLVDSTDWHLDEMAATRDPAKRDQQLARVKDNLDLIQTREGEGVGLLRLRGKLFSIQGKMVEAIQTLEKARQLAEQGGPGRANSLERWKIVDQLAKAYVETQQTGRAKDLLTDLVNRFPSYDRARVLLAQLLIHDGSLDQARPQVAYLAKRLPNNPEVLKFQIQLGMAPGGAAGASADAQHKQAMESYAKLPEQTTAQLMDKVKAALVTAQPQEVTRLLNKGLVQTPGDVDLVKTGVYAYQVLGDADAAKAIVASALKAKPNDPVLQFLEKQVSGLSVESLMNAVIEQAKSNPDHVTGELIQAKAYQRLGKPKEALDHLLAAQKLKPDDGAIRTQLFEHYLRQKQLDQAEALLPMIASNNDDQSNGTLSRFRLAMAKKDYPAATTQARELVQRMGEFAQSYVALGQAQQASGQFDDALKSFNQALDRQSDNADAFRGAIACSYALHRPADALSRIHDARRALPTNRGFQEMEIDYDLTYGDPTRAIPPREEQYNHNPENPQAMLKLAQAYLAGAHSLAGNAEPDKKQQAAQYLTKTRALLKKGVDKWPDEIAFYAYYAEAAAQAKQPGDTEQVLKALGARPAWKDKPDAQLLLAQFYTNHGRVPDAEAILRALFAKDPASIDIELKLANLLASQNKVDDALKALEPNAADARVAGRRIDLLIAAGRGDQAEKALADMARQNPRSLQALQILTGVNIARGHFDQAEAHVKQALALDPSNTTTHYYLGLLRASQPRPDLDAAVKAFIIARDSPTMGIESRMALAECYRRQLNPDAAIRELETALQQQPSDRRVRIALIDAYFAAQPSRWNDCERVINDARRLPGYQPDPDLLQREANMWSMRGKPDRAVQAITEALNAAPKSASLNQLALSLLNRAGRYADVVTRATAIIKVNSKLWWTYNDRAVAQAMLKKKDDALKDFDTALSMTTADHNDAAARDIVLTIGQVLSPDQAIQRIADRAKTNDRWKIEVARLQQIKGDNDAAVKTIEPVLAHADKLDLADRSAAYEFGGMIYLVTKQPEKAVDCYAKLLDIVPNDMTALNNMAYLLGEMTHPPRPEEGLKYSQRAYDLMTKGNRRDALVLDTHGWLLTLSGKVDEGIDVLRQANEIRDIPETHYHLAEAYLRKGLAEFAQNQAQVAQKLYKQLVHDKKPVDEQLGTRIDDVLNRAGQAIRQKKVADVPTGSGVP